MALGPLIPWIDRQWCDDVGNVLSGGLVYAFLAGTSTPTDTYTTSALSVENANPVVLDSSGRATIFLDPDITYKFVVEDSVGNELYSLDEVPGSIPNQTPITIQADGIGATSTDGIVLLNDTAAANAAQQWSPRVRWTGEGWNATASASRVVDATAEMVPLQQASGDPIAALTFSTQVNAGGYTPRLAIRSDGAIALGSSGAVAWSSSGLTSIDTRVIRTAAKKLALDDGAASPAGVILNFVTANTILFRNRADDGFAGVTAATYDSVGLYTASLVGATANLAGFVALQASLPNTTAGARIGFGRSGATNDGAFWAFRPQATAANATAELMFEGGAIPLTISSTGATTLTGTFEFTTVASSLVWTGESRITNLANAVIRLSNNAVTAGVSLRMSTDALLEIRNRTNAAAASIAADNVEAVSYTVGGVAGIDFNGAVTNLTVVNGLVTAAS